MTTCTMHGQLIKLCIYVFSELKVTYIKLNGKSNLLIGDALLLPLLDMGSGNRCEVGSVLEVDASPISRVVEAMVESGAA